MNSMGAVSIWLWSFIWTWQEAATAAHQREALWGEDQIRACDARIDRAKRRLWMHTRTHTHADQEKLLQHTRRHTAAKAFNLIPHFPFALTGRLHAQLCKRMCTRIQLHTNLLRFIFMLTILNMGKGVINRSVSSMFWEIESQMSGLLAWWSLSIKN